LLGEYSLTQKIMFLTITIDTNKKKNKPIRFHTKQFNAASGWRRSLHMKKRTLVQKFKQWRKNMKTSQYKLGDQRVMF